MRERLSSTFSPTLSVGKEIEALEDKADVLEAHGGKFFFTHCGDIVTLENDLACGRAQDAAHDGEQRGFAAAGWAHEEHNFATADGEVDAGESERAGFALNVLLGDAACFDCVSYLRVLSPVLLRQ